MPSNLHIGPESTRGLRLIARISFNRRLTANLASAGLDARTPRAATAPEGAISGAPISMAAELRGAATRLSSRPGHCGRARSVGGCSRSERGEEEWHKRLCVVWDQTENGEKNEIASGGHGNGVLDIEI